MNLDYLNIGSHFSYVFENSLGNVIENLFLLNFEVCCKINIKIASIHK